MTDTQNMLYVVRWMMSARREYPAFKVAMKAGRAACFKSTASEAVRKTALAAIEESIEFDDPASQLIVLRQKMHLPYSLKMLGVERRRYCKAFIASLRSVGAMDDMLQDE